MSLPVVLLAILRASIYLGGAIYLWRRGARRTSAVLALLFIAAVLFALGAIAAVAAFAVLTATLVTERMIRLGDLEQSRSDRERATPDT